MFVLRLRLVLSAFRPAQDEASADEESSVQHTKVPVPSGEIRLLDMLL
jgi:hypothetical protein